MTFLKHGTRREGRGLALREATKQCECEDGGFPTTVRCAYQTIECPTIYTVSDSENILVLGELSTNLLQIFPLQIYQNGARDIVSLELIHKLPLKP